MRRATTPATSWPPRRSPWPSSRRSANALLSHFADQCRRGGRSWSEISAALGVSKQAAHKRFSLATASLERWTPRARTALRAAAEAARGLSQGHVGTEHVLLGLFEAAGGIAARILDEPGFTRAQVKEQIVLATPPASPPSSSAVPDPPFTTRAESIDRAASEALSLGHNYVGTEHVLLALFGEPAGLAAKILADGRATRDDIRKRVLQKLSGLRP